MPYKGTKQSEYMRVKRDQFRARGLCQRCGTKPFLVIHRNGYSIERTKCKDCLRTAALDQKLHRERVNEKRSGNSRCSRNI